MYTVTKTFGEYPFAHRQHNHDGHCAYVHGHNWRFTVELQSDDLDNNGFVYDFGKFGWLKSWLEFMFDHTLLINQDDPHLEFFQEHCVKDAKNPLGLWDMRVIPNGSAEHLAELVGRRIQSHFEDDKRIQLVSLTVMEDNKNAAIWKPE